MGLTCADLTERTTGPAPMDCRPAHLGQRFRAVDNEKLASLGIVPAFDQDPDETGFA